MIPSEEEFVYCSNWKCDHVDCMRHHNHQPFNVLTLQCKWSPDKNGVCKKEVLRETKH